MKMDLSNLNIIVKDLQNKYIEISNHIKLNKVDHGFEFDITINKYPISYASTPLFRGYSYPKDVWSVYLYGSDSLPDTTGSISVYGSLSNSHVKLSPTSTVLKIGLMYHIKWTYSNTFGGELWINSDYQGKINSVGPLNLSLGKEIITDKILYHVNNGRYHSILDGNIINIKVFGKKEN